MPRERIPLPLELPTRTKSWGLGGTVFCWLTGLIISCSQLLVNRGSTFIKNGPVIDLQASLRKNGKLGIASVDHRPSMGDTLTINVWFPQGFENSVYYSIVDDKFKLSGMLDCNHRDPIQLCRMFYDIVALVNFDNGMTPPSLDGIGAWRYYYPSLCYKIKWQIHAGTSFYDMMVHGKSVVYSPGRRPNTPYNMEELLTLSEGLVVHLKEGFYLISGEILGTLRVDRVNLDPLGEQHKLVAPGTATDDNNLFVAKEEDGLVISNDTLSGYNYRRDQPSQLFAPVVRRAERSFSGVPLVNLHMYNGFNCYGIYRRVKGGKSHTLIELIGIFNNTTERDVVEGGITADMFVEAARLAPRLVTIIYYDSLEQETVTLGVKSSNFKASELHNLIVKYFGQEFAEKAIGVCQRYADELAQLQSGMLSLVGYPQAIIKGLGEPFASEFFGHLTSNSQIANLAPCVKVNPSDFPAYCIGFVSQFLQSSRYERVNYLMKYINSLVVAGNPASAPILYKRGSLNMEVVFSSRGVLCEYVSLPCNNVTALKAGQYVEIKGQRLNITDKGWTYGVLAGYERVEILDFKPERSLEPTRVKFEVDKDLLADTNRLLDSFYYKLDGDCKYDYGKITTNDELMNLKFVLDKYYTIGSPSFYNMAILHAHDLMPTLIIQEDEEKEPSYIEYRHGSTLAVNPDYTAKFQQM